MIKMIMTIIIIVNITVNDNKKIITSIGIYKKNNYC